MYGSSVQYGWNSGGRPSDVVELPLAPVRQQSSGMCFRNCMNWHTFGILLSLLAAASLALGVADVVITWQTYMVGWSCSTTNTNTYSICYPANLIWTWIASGIWCSFPVFIFGIIAIRKATNPMPKNSCFELLAFVCAVFFTTAMVVLSSIEVWKGAGIYYWPYVTPLRMDDMPKAIIPIVIAVLGFVEHIMCAMALCDVCCCSSTMETYSSRPVQVMAPPVQMMAPPVMRTTAITTSGGCNTCPQSKTIYNSSPYSMGGGPNYSSSFYTASAPARPSTYNYFSGGNAAFKPNSAYNFYR